MDASQAKELRILQSGLSDPPEEGLTRPEK
jgi:hypothetical protein